MADAQSSFRFILHKFSSNIPNKTEVKQLSVCLRRRFVVILFQSGQLSVRSLQREEENVACSIDTGCSVLSFSVDSEKSDTYQNFGGVHIALISESLHLLLLSNKDGKFTRDADIDLQTVIHKDCMLADLQSVDIVQYTKGSITVQADSVLLIHFLIKDNALSLASKMDINQGNDGTPNTKLLNAAYINVDIKSKISCYSFDKVELLWEIDISRAVLDATNVQTWSMDDDFSNLVIATQSGEVQILDIKSYCKTYPQCLWTRKMVSKSKTLSLHTYLETCQYGDLAWRDKLLDFHNSNQRQPANHSQLSQKETKFTQKYRTVAMVTGFSSRKKHHSASPDSCVQIVKAPENVRGFSIDEMNISNNDIYIVYGYNGQCVITRWNTECEQWMQYSLMKGDIPILSKDPGLPHIVATETHIDGVMMRHGMNQEQFVSDLMAYGDAGLADTLCHLNSWGRCSIPLHTLQVGLKHRQFDTVAFFLKSKEKVFTSTHASIIQQENCQSGAPEYSHLETAIQLHAEINLLLESVRNTLGDKHAKIFGKQILDIGMDFLYELLLDGLAVSESLPEDNEKKDLLSATEKLLEYIASMRQCVQSLEQYNDSASRSDNVSMGSVSEVSQSDATDCADNVKPSTPTNASPPIFSQWDQMDIETVIEDGIMKNILPELQLFLLQRGEYSRADYAQLKSCGSDIAVNYIHYGNMDKAKEIFIKLGLSATEELWKLALTSTDLIISNSIFEELQTFSLSKEQNAMVTFFKELNELYPCRDFDQLKNKHKYMRESEGHEVLRLKNLISQPEQNDFTQRCGNLRTQKTQDMETPLPYNEVLLDWVQQWDDETRQFIKLDVLIHNPGSDLSSFSLGIVWDYLTMRNLSDILIAWIHNSFPSNHGNAEPKWPSTHLGQVPIEFVDRTELCTFFTRNEIYKAFSIHGVYSEDCLSDFQILLNQLCKVGGPLQLPHPHQASQMISMDLFHSQMAQYCIQHNLPYFLWTYCTYFGIDVNALSELGADDQTWLPLFYKFIGVTQSQNVREYMHDGSIQNAMTVWNEDTASVGQLLQSGHTLAALATLMYSHHKLTQVTFVTQQLEAFNGLSSEVVEQAIHSYPKLHVTLFPASAIESPQTDISVYQLLIGNAPFDPAKLFGWQSTNTCAGEDCGIDMPYFSQPGLVTQYGHVEHLRYNYYLKQARPSFAFVTFLAEELKNGSPTIPPKRLCVAIGTSLWLGVKRFYNTQISSACVVFQEMLGDNSLLLRTYIQVGTEILSYRNNAVTGTMDKRREQMKHNENDVVELLLQCVQTGKSAAQTLLNALEGAILAAVTRERLSIFDAGHRWTIAVLFCHLLHMPYSTVFLESCAETKQWLPFMWFAQIHQYPTEQLLSLLHKFPSSHIQEHLRYVLMNAVVRSSQAEEKKVLAKHRSERVAKDVRSNLYSRIGLMKDADTDVSSSSEEDENLGRLNLPDNDTDEDDTAVSILEEEIDHVEQQPLHQYFKKDIALERLCTVLLDIIFRIFRRLSSRGMLVIFGNTEFLVSFCEVAHVTSESAPGDVFGVIFAAQGCKYPWKSLLLHAITLRNCLFAELAVCLEGSSSLPCLIGWLVAMMDVIEHTQFIEDHGTSPWRYTLHTLDSVIDVYISKQWGSLLVTGFDIFQQSSPLLPFLQFYAEFTERHNYRNCKLLLEEFKESVFQFHHESKGNITTSVGDSDWLERTTFRIIQYMLTRTPSCQEVSQLLKILDTECITLVFKNLDADFTKQSQMLLCIEEGEIAAVNLGNLLAQNSNQYDQECLSIIDKLMSKRLYRLARRFAGVTGINTDHVTMNQVNYEKDKISCTVLWNLQSARLQFYQDCTDRFNKYGLSAEKVAEFFKSEAELITSPLERASLYQMCLACISKQENTDNDVWTRIYRNIWTNRIQARINSTESVLTDETKTGSVFTDIDSSQKSHAANAKSELMFCGKMPHSSDVGKGLSEQEVSAIQYLLGDLLKQGRITEACRLAVEFSIYSQDLAILLTCIRLSMGSLSLDTMPPEMLHLLRTRPGDSHRQSIAAPVALLRNSSSISLMSNIQPVIDTVSDENEAKISAMECLLNHCDTGRQTCIRIITAFKIASVLYIGYDDVVTGEDYFILRSLLKTTCSAKFRLSADFLGTSSLSSEQIASFLSDAILQSYRISLGDMNGDRDLFFDPGENFADFHQIVRLCIEPTLLGNKLVDIAASLADDLDSIDDKVLTLQTELLILAHECYTASCDMEGISNILRAARILTTHLQVAGEHQLMARLLTGVGRYNEMTYIFDALQLNHKFELLLGKGKEKETKLKTAILDYLKRYHPADTETYTMVALKFMMYREIAQLLENNANRVLDSLRGKPLDNSSETQSLLQKCVQYLSEAAESYVKDSCLRHAQSCIRKARLVALQITYLSSSQQFINLTTKGANLLISEHSVFTEAFIISEAYQLKDNWVAALCNNVVNLGSMKYLQDFRSNIRLTPSLIEDVVDRYQQSVEKSPQAPNNMKKLLQYCKDVKVQYRVAKQLGLRDYVHTLEKGDAKSYIMDFAKIAT